jgi:predicted ATP-dependent endonuclease of OLD family
MLISNVSISNYRGIKKDSFEASPFNCAIGENNAGKSSILLATSLFFSGASLSSSDYYNPNEEIEIEISFCNIEEGDFHRLISEHRDRIKELILDGKLTLTRLYSLDGKSELLCQRSAPKDARFGKTVISELLKGKKGKDLETAIVTLFPEYKERFSGLTTQAAINKKIEDIISELQPDQMEMKRSSLPTGIDNSIKTFLPDPIYIAAVKDLKDEVKTKESTTFGKLLGILLKSLEDSKHFEEIAQSFNNLYSMLNVIRDDQNITDNRIDKLKAIENQITGYLKENFSKSSVEIEIPKPELKQIFSNAKILIDDGVKDVIETKGDGIKRAVTFALLRTYVDNFKEQRKEQSRAKMVASEEASIEDSTEVRPLEQPYLFLFEEPELFLHPNAQKILFEALENLSKENNQVFVTTHSPLFFSPYSTGTFIKVVKEYPSGSKPFGKFISVNLLKEVEAKDAFQIMCYENNAAAFFSNKVVLVEGDSDMIYLKEVSRLLNPDWNFDCRNIPIISINGKSNVKRYIDFFSRFNIKTYTIVDSDALIDGFEKFDVCDESKQKRDRLLKLIDQLAEETLAEAQLNADKIKELIRKYSFKERYNRLKILVNKIKAKEEILDDELTEIEHLFSEETLNLRRQIFNNKALELDGKHDLLELLRTQSIFILADGTIENYYPSGMVGADKPTKALNTVKFLKQQEDCRKFLPKFKTGTNEVCELDLIFEKVFE